MVNKPPSFRYLPYASIVNGLAASDPRYCSPCFTSHSADMCLLHKEALTTVAKLQHSLLDMMSTVCPL